MNLDALYPTMAPDAKAPAPPAPPEPSLHERVATQLYDTMQQPGEKKTEPQSGSQPMRDPADVLYGDSQYAETVLITDVPANATPEQVEAANKDTRAQFQAMEIPGQTARTLTERFTAAMRAPISDAEYDRKASTFKTDLAARFGSHENVEERLADVCKLLAKADPAVVTALVESGLNVDVDTIVELANHARSLKGRGRLK